MLDNQFRMLGDVACVEVGDSKVEDYIKYVADIEYCEIKAVHLGSNGVLHTNVDAKNPKRLDKQVGKQHPKQSGNQLFIQFSIFNFSSKSQLALISRVLSK